ncbi:MAG: hypothetical protein JJT88_04235 [Gammaproteobacteria bacterium]|nr:hypothetical protein [Gammaproteobacteria bacterium]
MYIAMVASLMVVLPMASILIESRLGCQPLSAALALRWFVFWGLGVRLLSAGLSQIFRPRYTAEVILGLDLGPALFLVRELGFANTAVGLIAVASILVRAWTLPLALIGAVFYGLAGVNHLLHDDRNLLQNVAMVSDLFMASVLTVLTLLVIAKTRARLGS